MPPNRESVEGVVQLVDRLPSIPEQGDRGKELSRSRPRISTQPIDVDPKNLKAKFNNCRLLQSEIKYLLRLDFKEADNYIQRHPQYFKPERPENNKNYSLAAVKKWAFGLVIKKLCLELDLPLTNRFMVTGSRPTTNEECILYISQHLTHLESVDASQAKWYYDAMGELIGKKHFVGSAEEAAETLKNEIGACRIEIEACKAGLFNYYRTVLNQHRTLGADLSKRVQGLKEVEKIHAEEASTLRLHLRQAFLSNRLNHKDLKNAEEKLMDNEEHHHRQMKEMKEAHKKEKMVVEEHHKKAYKQLIEEHHKKIEDLVQKHENTLHSVLMGHNTELLGLKMNIEKAFKNREYGYKKEVKILKDSHLEELKAVKEELREVKEQFATEKEEFLTREERLTRFVSAERSRRDGYFDLLDDIDAKFAWMGFPVEKYLE